jgi:hypothetical protein
MPSNTNFFCEENVTGFHKAFRDFYPEHPFPVLARIRVGLNDEGRLGVSGRKLQIWANVVSEWETR